MPRLNIPYRSQWDDDARFNNSDCGPTCLAMVLNYFGVDITPDGVYAFLPDTGPNDFTTFGDLMRVARHFGLRADYASYGEITAAFGQLRAQVDAGRSPIALVKYRPWAAVTGNPYEWGHFVVVTGYDDAHVAMHDPLFGLWVQRDRGAHVAMPLDLFAAGWGGFPADENPNWACVIVDRLAAPVPEPVPVPQPGPLPTPPEPPAPTPRPLPVPAPTAPTMVDESRRIRALAAYRWAEAPDFADATAVQLWRDHLGDFGLTYEAYVVQAGDTLAGLAARFYGEQHRWHAIRAYNNLQREGLWLGETLLIPHLGQSGAYRDPALPSDTTDFAKAVALDDVVDPGLPAQDYNALGRNATGIGFVTAGE